GKSDGAFVAHHRLFELRLIEMLGPIVVPHLDLAGLSRRRQRLTNGQGNQSKDRKTLAAIHGHSSSNLLMVGRVLEACLRALTQPGSPTEREFSYSWSR